MTRDRNTDIDEKLLDDFAEELHCYFFDYGHDEAIGMLRDDFLRFPDTKRVFQRSLEIAIALPDTDCLDLVQNCTDRYVGNSPAVAREWLCALRDQLFSSS